MSREPYEVDPPKTLWMHIRNAWEKISASQPVSFYLLLAIIVVLVLGLQIVHFRDDPRRFAFFMTLFLIFFFAVLVRAIVDFIEIVKQWFTERERLYRLTLGEKNFVDKLGRGVEEQRRQQ